MILALWGGLWLGGCRTPSAPARGWVRLSALTPLHPNQVMLADLDHRLDSLAAQRTRLFGRAELALPPESVEQTLPAWEALSSPDAPVIPAPPSLAPGQQQVLEDYRKRSAEIGKRLLIRQERELQQQIDRQRKEDSTRISKNKDDEWRAKQEALRTPLIAAQLRTEMAKQAWETAAQQATTNNAQYQVAQQQYSDAQKQYQQAQLALPAPRPGSSAVPPLATANTRLLDAKNRLQQLNTMLPSLKLRAEHYHTSALRAEALYTARAKEFQALRDDEQQQWQAIEQEAKSAENAAESGYTHQILQQETTAERDIDRRIAGRMAARQTQLQSAHVDVPLPAPEPTLSFPARPAGTQRMEMPTFRDAVGKTDVKALRVRLDATRVLDQLIERLQAERQLLRDTIARDTRAAVGDIAAQHGYTLVFDHPAGKDLTQTARGWLSHYWPPE